MTALRRFGLLAPLAALSLAGCGLNSVPTAEERVKLLAGGNDTEQLYEEIVRLKPQAAIIALHGANADQAVKFIERLQKECPETALISAAQDASPAELARWSA